MFSKGVVESFHTDSDDDMEVVDSNHNMDLNDELEVLLMFHFNKTTRRIFKWNHSCHSQISCSYFAFRSSLAKGQNLKRSFTFSLLGTIPPIDLSLVDTPVLIRLLGSDVTSTSSHVLSSMGLVGAVFLDVVASLIIMDKKCVSRHCHRLLSLHRQATKPKLYVPPTAVAFAGRPIAAPFGVVVVGVAVAVDAAAAVAVLDALVGLVRSWSISSVLVFVIGSRQPKSSTAAS
jgi:hypothetical protein